MNFRGPSLTLALGASIGLQLHDCCWVASYVSHTSLFTEGRISGTNARMIDAIMDGGIEFGVFDPWLSRFSLSLRGGIAGTPPDDHGGGRRGLAASVAARYRVSGDAAIKANVFEPLIEATLGFSFWSLQEQVTSYGLDDAAARGCTALLGVRLGASHGLDLR